MDLAKLKPSERQVEIVSPGTKEPIGIRVSIVHIGDDRLKKLKRHFADERYRLESKGKMFKAEMAENNENELVFAAMTGWEWYNPTGMKGDEGYDADRMPHFNGEQPQFNKKNVMEIFEALPWLRSQLATEMGDDEAFFPH